MDTAALAEVRRRSHRASFITAFGAIIIFGAILFAVLTIQHAETRLAGLKQQQEKVQNEIDQLTQKRQQALADLNALSQATASALGYAKDKRPSTPMLVQSAKAESLVQAAPATNATARGTVNVTIYAKGFEQDANQNVLLPKLRNLGFAVRVVEGRGYIARIPTNAIWFGRDVPLEDVRLLALSLMSAGVTIRTIRPFDDRSRKTNAIEVGADARFANAPPLTLPYVSQAQAFNR